MRKETYCIGSNPSQTFLNQDKRTTPNKYEDEQ